MFVGFVLREQTTINAKLGDDVHVEFYENNIMLGVIDYSDKSMYYVESAIENFLDGILNYDTIDRFKIKDSE